MNPLINSLAARVSVPRLREPAPDPDTLYCLFQAALNVPDHLQLKPWRFLLIEGEARHELGRLFANAEKMKNPNCSQEDLDKKAAKALRSPMIIVGICAYQAHEKVPEIEQQLSTACVLHNLGLGLRSLGFASIWRTGSFAFDRSIMQGLGLNENESIAGYLYVGSADGKEKSPREIDVNAFVTQWQA